MKKIYKYTFLMVAAFLLVPLTTKADGIDLSKKVTTNDNGSYTITLETFTTGTVTVKNESKPTDIVMVLDVSSSMARYGRVQQSTLRTALNGKTATLDNLYSVCKSEYFFTRDQDISTNGTAQTIYWKDEDGKWYSRTGRLRRNSNNSTYIEWSGDDTTEVPGTTTLTTYCTYRIYLLIASAKAFANQVYQDAMYDDEGELRDTPTDHKIAIVAFADATTGGNIDLDLTQVSSGLSTIKSTISGLDETVRSGTYSATGLATARDILYRAADGENATKRNRLVLFFTDGASNEASAAVARAREIKNTYDGRAINAKIYAVGLLDNADDGVHRYMNAVSSNYPNATNNTDATMGTPSDPSYSTTGSNQGYYYMTTTGADLGDIFDHIASGVQTETAEITEAAVVLDVMSGYFKLPDGATVDNINLYTCAANIANTNHETIDQLKWAANYSQAGLSSAATNGKTVYKDAANNVVPNSVSGGWTEYWEPWTPWDTATVAGGKVKSYYLTVDEDDQSVEVTGFDYSKYAVSPITNATSSPYWAGRKLIIEFVIWPDVENPGGATLQTNDPSSGVIYTYIDSNGQEQTSTQNFEVPTVTLPNIIIRKFGLEPEEGSSFKLVKLKNNGSETTPNWVEDTSVKPYYIVVVGDDNPLNFDFVQVKLQRPGRYRVTETDWGWSYTCSGGSKETVNSVEALTETTMATSTTAKMKEFDKDGTLVVTVVTSEAQPYIDRDVSGNTEQTILLPSGSTLSGAVFDFMNTRKDIEQRSYSEAHKMNPFPIVSTPERSR